MVPTGQTECREFSSQVNRVCATHGARLEVGEEGGVEGAESGRSRSQAGGAVPRNLPDIMEINSQRAKLEALFSMWVTKLQVRTVCRFVFKCLSLTATLLQRYSCPICWSLTHSMLFAMTIILSIFLATNRLHN